MTICPTERALNGLNRYMYYIHINTCKICKSNNHETRENNINNNVRSDDNRHKRSTDTQNT